MCVYMYLWIRTQTNIIVKRVDEASLFMSHSP